MNNFLKSNIYNDSFVTTETVTFYIGSSDKCLLGLNNSNCVVTAKIFLERTVVQNQVYLMLCYSIFTFYIEKEMNLLGN